MAPATGSGTLSQPNCSRTATTFDSCKISWGRYWNATVIHDWLYWTQTRPRREADAILLEAMGVLDVRPLVKYTMYWAVRLFGWLAWYRNQADRADGFDRVLRDVRFKSVVRSQRKGALRQVASYALRRFY